MQTKTLSLILPLLLLLIGSATSAQELPGKRDSINSTILGEKRLIQVLLPEKYKPGSTDTYDVLYVLDGEGNTKIMSDIQRFIEGEAHMPPTIIVGILNTDRNRDFLPTHVDNTATSGGADKFLLFLKDELIPHVNRTYPSDKVNTIFGHSFGGVFVTYALITEPQLFRSYVAADPSYWWDRGVMIKMVAAKLTGLAGMNKSFYISGREGHGVVEMNIPPMDSLLKKQAPASLAWKVIAYPDETHGTVRLKSMYDGLRFSYAGYSTRGISFHPMAGIVVKDKPITFWYFGDTVNVRYTTDGTEPTVTSAPMKKENLLSAPGKVTARLFTDRPRYDKTFSGDFKAGAALPAGKLQKNMRPGGFDYAYYEGEWNKLPNFDSLQPAKTGKIDSSFSIDKMPGKKNFALVISGQVEIKEEGYYVFVMDSDDGSRLYLANQLLIDYDGLHGSGALVKSYVVPLKKGFYPIRVEYFQKDGDRKLVLEYLRPGIPITKDTEPIPLALQYGKN